MKTSKPLCEAVRLWLLGVLVLTLNSAASAQDTRRQTASTGRQQIDNSIHVTSEEIDAYKGGAEVKLRTSLAKVSQDKKDVYLYLSNVELLGCETLPDRLEDAVLQALAAKAKSEPNFILLVYLPNRPGLSPGRIGKEVFPVVFFNPKRAYLIIIRGSVTLEEAGDLIRGTLTLEQAGGTAFSHELRVKGRFAATRCK
jgi:hypothetical protein